MEDNYILCYLCDWEWCLLFCLENWKVEVIFTHDWKSDEQAGQVCGLQENV